MTDDFSNAPVSIAELKSDKTQKSSDWTPRDVLIETLRRIDNGEIEPRSLLVTWAGDGSRDNLIAVGVRHSSPNLITAMGLVAAADKMLWEDND